MKYFLFSDLNVLFFLQVGHVPGMALCLIIFSILYIRTTKFTFTKKLRAGLIREMHSAMRFRNVCLPVCYLNRKDWNKQNYYFTSCFMCAWSFISRVVGGTAIERVWEYVVEGNLLMEWLVAGDNCIMSSCLICDLHKILGLIRMIKSGRWVGPGIQLSYGRWGMSKQFWLWGMKGRTTQKTLA